jgi:mannose-6-phosphate isomerase
MNSPLTFQPIFMERMWGGRRLESEFRKALPAGKRIGESWEIVDRPEAQSVVTSGALKGKTLHELWMQDRQSIFGDMADAARFPLLIKLLDAEEKLSIQVHPPEKVASKLGSEAKTEFWYVAAAEPGAELFVGFRDAITRDQFEAAIKTGTVAQLVQSVCVNAGDAMFLPAGRLHAIGGGVLLVEIQQNSDTTYRVFDWNRVDETGKARELHVDQALQCIDFDDVVPKLEQPKGELLILDDSFAVQKWNLRSSREVAPRGQFAIVGCLTGSLGCADVNLAPGEFCLVPASLQDRQLDARAAGTTLLRVTIP